MDTITHGIAGALMGKSLFGGRDLIAKGSMTRQRIVTWALMLGAIFPDIDVIRDMLSRDPMLILTWHRSITHSLVCLPLWALVLAALTRWFAGTRKWEAPSFAALTALYGAGILSHIVLDLVTSFGTMIWSPLNWSRPAWDLVFIIDLAFSTILLLPQLLAWVNADGERAKRRMLFLSAIALPLPFLIAIFLQNVGAPISTLAIIVATVFLGALLLLPVVSGWGPRRSYASWNRAGFLAACLYVVATIATHHAALQRVQKFAAIEHLQVNALGALPFPPSLWHWDGLVRTPRGVYEFRTDLSARPTLTIPTQGQAAAAEDSIEYNFYPDARDNPVIEQARQLPEVQKVLWFARFPVVRFHREGAVSVVEFADLRFPQMRRYRPAAFTYRVTLDASGNVLSKGWRRD
jgi:membrane-bound metal-dependent hydrolase YbcI (DUF457 family)